MSGLTDKWRLKTQRRKIEPFLKTEPGFPEPQGETGFMGSRNLNPVASSLDYGGLVSRQTGESVPRRLHREPTAL